MSSTFPPVPGAPVTTPYQFSYNGLLFGAETDWELIDIIGLDPAPIRSNISARMQGHGSFTYAPFLAERQIIMTGDIAVQGHLQSWMNEWSKAMAPQTADLPMTFFLPGQGLERVYVKPVERNFRIDRGFSIGYGLWATQFVAGDPRIYSEDLYTETGTTGSNLVAQSGGSFQTPPVLSLLGPIDTPTITHVESGKSLTLNLLLSAGQTAVFDFAARTIKIGGNSIYYSLDSASQWFAFEPGTNTLDLAGTSTTGATLLTAEWRDARI